MPRSNITLGGQELKLDADADTSITVDTDDTIDVKVGGTDTVKVTGTQTDIKVSASRELNILKDSSDDALTTLASSFVKGGKLRRVACGSNTKKKLCIRDKPRALPASV